MARVAQRRPLRHFPISTIAIAKSKGNQNRERVPSIQIYPNLYRVHFVFADTDRPDPVGCPVLDVRHAVANVDEIGDEVRFDIRSFSSDWMLICRFRATCGV